MSELIHSSIQGGLEVVIMAMAIAFIVGLVRSF